ncbi:MAG TPA: T9SS type A sorting domain-containing protein [Bacteroidetes bacterium]|nr:T9SS type A sorting domain-containing protein [Bacteroidota bacterium]
MFRNSFLKISLPAFLWCFALFSNGQEVSFSYQAALLNPVSGFTTYADCAVDMNGDFLDDVVRVGNKVLYIDFQKKEGGFSQKNFPLIVQNPPDWSICAGDLDNNGFNDLQFASGSAVSFVYANEMGSGYLESLMPDSILSQRSTMADINNDGWLDAFVCHDIGQSLPFKNDGTGQMASDTNLIHTSTLPGNYAAIWTDYDHDGDTDLYISKCLSGAPPGNPSRTNLLYQNNGDGSFSEVAGLAGLNDNSQSWSTVFEDFDNDGDMDAFIVNHDFKNRLLRNNGDGTFTDVIDSSGIDPEDLGAWENTAADFNNDGFADIFSDLSNELYLGNGDLTFVGQSVPTIPGSIADLNNDGYLDVYRANQLWMNDGGPFHWLKVNLFGIESNRNGIGARVEIYGAWGIQVREMRSGQGFSPMNSLNLHFGLGQEKQVDSLLVKWPSGIVSKLENLQADSSYLVPEAACLLPFTLINADEYKLCPGDTILLEAPAGFSQYRWSNGQTSQLAHLTKAGRYFVLMTDSEGCTSLSNFIKIEEKKDVPPSIFAVPAKRRCEGNSIELVVSHGQNPIWSNGLTGQRTDVLASGNYSVSVDAACAGGQLVSLPFEVEILPAPPPLIADISIGAGDSVLLVADSENCYWYDQPMAEIPLHIGSVFQTPPLTSDTVFYVETHYEYPAEMQVGGKLDMLGDGGVSQQTGYQLFDAWQPFILRSVDVYLPPESAEGFRFVQLFSEDTLLAFKQFEVQTGWNEVQLDFDVPVGKLSLHCPQGVLFRNTGQLGYPFPIGDVGQVTSSSFGEGYYYYFYNWKIETRASDCVSERVSVEVLISGNDETHLQEGIGIFPNPSSGTLYFKQKKQAAKPAMLRLYDIAGREVFHQKIAVEEVSAIQLYNLPAGIYLLKYQQEGGRFFYEKLILK